MLQKTRVKFECYINLMQVIKCLNAKIVDEKYPM